jgi:hypothetical protein
MKILLSVFAPVASLVCSFQPEIVEIIIFLLDYDAGEFTCIRCSSALRFVAASSVARWSCNSRINSSLVCGA